MPSTLAEPPSHHTQRAFGPVLSPLAHPSSVEFLAAYAAYVDREVAHGYEPLAASCWRERVIAGLLV